jgi:hypothetical protein
MRVIATVVSRDDLRQGAGAYRDGVVRTLVPVEEELLELREKI